MTETTRPVTDSQLPMPLYHQVYSVLAQRISDGTYPRGLRIPTEEELTVEFGVKLGGETGIILAKGTAEVNLKITMTWDRETGQLEGAASGEV